MEIGLEHLQPGALIHQRYALHQQLAQNAGRHTWLAKDTTTEPPQPVVVKLLTLGGDSHWEELKLFEREGQILRQLSHPSIPRYIDSFALEEGLSFGLVQTHIPGKSLKQLLQNGEHFTAEEVQLIARSVLDILIYLHELSPPILHRDIKPSNLILGDDGTIYLIDFGAVQDRASTEGRTFTVVGTYGYAPIEQYGGQTVPASDLYSLGATLIHLATGVTPMELPQTETGMQFSDRVSPSPALEKWLTKLVKPLISQRFATAREALQALETGLLEPESLAGKNYEFTHLDGSRIRAQADDNCLTIHIPALNASIWSSVSFIARVVGGILVLLVSLVFPALMLFSLIFYGELSVGGVIFLLVLVVPAFIIPVRLWNGLAPSRSLHLRFDRQQLQTKSWVGQIPYGQKTYALQGLQQVFSDKSAVCLRFHQGDVSLAKGLALSTEELNWLAQAIDRWLQQ